MRKANPVRRISIILHRSLVPSAIGLLLCLQGLSALAQNTKSYEPTNSFTKKTMHGWTVYISGWLQKNDPELAKTAEELLDQRLREIDESVPAKAVEFFKTVTIWLCEKDPHGKRLSAVYHGGASHLRKNGENPDKAKCVELANAKNFVAWKDDQPSMVLHEIAHAYHFRVLGTDHEGIKRAFEKAKASGSYEKVKDRHGNIGRHYALNNEKEYFAEGTEAYFRRNDSYPFVRAELLKHDPDLYALLEEVWKPEPKFNKATVVEVKPEGESAKVKSKWIVEEVDSAGSATTKRPIVLYINVCESSGLDENGRTSSKIRKVKKVVDAFGQMVLTDSDVFSLMKKCLLLQIDGAREDNKEILKKYKVRSWPCLLILDYKGKVLYKVKTSAKAKQVVAILQGTIKKCEKMAEKEAKD